MNDNTESTYIYIYIYIYIKVIVIYNRLSINTEMSEINIMINKPN